LRKVGSQRAGGERQEQDQNQDQDNGNDLTHEEPV
jgi:hypothetical protein